MVTGIKGQLRDREVAALERALVVAEENYAQAAQRKDSDLAAYETAVRDLESQISSLDNVRVN